MLFLASCEMGRRTENRYEREAVSFSNAALVGWLQLRGSAGPARQ